MKKGNTTRVPQRRTALDRITAQLRKALRRETVNIIEAGKLLIESRKHLEHGEWQAWLGENFDLTDRTARSYVRAAEYVAGKTETVSDFGNLSPSVLYALARGQYDDREEAAILTAIRERRVDWDAAWDICKKLAPPPPDDHDDDDADGEDDGGQHADDGDDAAEDPEISAIIEGGADPDVPPTAPIPPPVDFALRDFEEAIGKLKTVMTKPSAQFARTVHSAEDLESVADFVCMVRQQLRTATTQPPADDGLDSPACLRRTPV